MSRIRIFYTFNSSKSKSIKNNKNKRIKYHYTVGAKVIRKLRKYVLIIIPILLVVKLKYKNSNYYYKITVKRIP